MKNRTHPALIACFLWIIAICLFPSCKYEPGRSGTAATQPRADLINIDMMKAFGRLKKQPVEFLHDAHIKALAAKNLDCTACHLTENDRLSLKFQRTGDTDKTAVMNTYHKGCIACHGEMRLAHQKAGPIECDGCHREKAFYVSSGQPMGFDKSLHSRHSEALQNKCEKCHHEYDEKQKKLIYVKGKEETCRYCHLDETKDNVLSMPSAAHLACLGCHRKNLAEKRDSGPITCEGCHDAAAREKIKKISPVPRMERQQPDVVLLKAVPNAFEAGMAGADRMNAVPFDHKAHEGYTDTCRGCHHDTLRPCHQCHTLAGVREGGGIKLEEAMHRTNAPESCVGCHARQQGKTNCAGCHAFMKRELKQNDDAACLTCHMKPAPATGEEMTTPEMEKSLAAEMLRSRTPGTGTYPENEIPEKVVIKGLAKEYGPVDFPHRKIVDALINNMKDNKLAAYFHDGEGTICRGCHHNSPVSKQPPLCGNCHAATFDPGNPLKPEIKAAYHLQCIGCHNVMKISKSDDCAKCHKEKK